MQLRITMTLASSLILTMVSGCAGGLKGLGLEQETIPEVSAPPFSPPPDWVLSKDDPRFPKARYLIGVGTHDNNSVFANESARLELAKTLKVKIRSKMVDVSTTEQQYVESVIETEVDTVLEGVEIKDGWEDQAKGVYYSLAIVERSLAASSTQNKVSKIESILQRNLSEGVEAENRADVINALSHYLSGYQKAPSLPPLKSALHVITGPRESSGSQNISAGEFESKITGIVHNLNLATVSGDRQIVKTRKGVAEPLVAKVYLLKGENQIPVSNVPVLFSYEVGQGELEQKKTSGSDGTVQTTIHKISSYEESNHVIAVKLDYSSIRSNFNGDFVNKLLLPLKNKRATFNYAIQTPKWPSNQSQFWRESITDLGNQLIRNIPPGESPLLGVMPSKDLRTDQVTRFSRILDEDIKTILALAEDLILKEIKINGDRRPEEIAKANGLDYYVSSSYRMEKTGLEVRSHLIDTETSNIHGTGTVLIERKELNPEDLKLLDKMAEEFKFFQRNKSYQEYLEKLIAAKPYKSSCNVKVSTVKKEENNQEAYQIGEKITFSISAEEDCYLTLLDINPEGKITVIFPNKYEKNNLIHAGTKNFQIPDPKRKNLLKTYEFKVQPPHGEERIKAIASLDSGFPIKLDYEMKGFHIIQPGTIQGMRDIEALAKFYLSTKNSNWSEAYFRIFIHEKGKVYTRGSRKIPILPKPDKPKDMIGTFGNEEKRNE